MYVRMHACLLMDICMGPRGLGDLGRGLFIFRELGRTGNYFKELGSKLMVLGSPANSKKINLLILP